MGAVLPLPIPHSAGWMADRPRWQRTATSEDSSQVIDNMSNFSYIVEGSKKWYIGDKCAPIPGHYTSRRSGNEKLSIEEGLT